MKDLSTTSTLLRRTMSELRRTPTRVSNTAEHIDNELIDKWLEIESDDAEWTQRWRDKVNEMKDKNYAKQLDVLDSDREELETIMLERVKPMQAPEERNEDTKEYRRIYSMTGNQSAVLNHNNPFAHATTSNSTYTHISAEGIRKLQLTKIEQLTSQHVDGHSIVTSQPSLRVIDNNIKLEIGDDILTEQRYKLEWRE